MNIKQEKLYDLKELRTIAAGDHSFMDYMIKLFITQIETSLLDIGNSMIVKDFAKIKTIIHKIKPSVEVMGVVTAKTIILQVELLELSAANESLFTDQIQKLQNIFAEVNDQLRSI